MANTTDSTPRTGARKPKKAAPKKPATKTAAKPKAEKSSAAKKAAPSKSTATSKGAANRSAGVKPEPTDQAARPITSEERHRLIAQAAYLRAEKRGFLNGDPEQDWLEAEKEIDAALTMGKNRPRKG